MSLLGDWCPRLESPASVRRFLACAALATTALLVYASVVPLHYRPLSWESTWEAWRQIPWLSLDVFHRADWVANALVALPAGLLAAAAVDWGRQSSWPLVLATPLITFALTLVIIGIELVQVWFPPRTVSLNDIAAGFVGAALGPMLWAIGGSFFERGITRFLTLPCFRDRLMWLCVGWLVGIIVYSVLPLDLIMSRSEWQERLASGRVRWNPFPAGVSLLPTIGDFSLAALRMAPVGVLFALLGDRRKARLALWLLPVGLELIQLPFYSKHVTSVAVVGGWIGGWLGYVFTTQLHRFESLARRPALWGVGWVCAVALTLLLLLARFEQVLDNPVTIQNRYDSAWTLPLVRYYSGSEYSAYTVIVEKMALFGAIGACCAGWRNTVSPRTGRLIFWLSLLAVGVAAFAIERLQVYLPPLVPDFSDAIVYLIGYAAGYQVMQILWGQTAPAQPSE